MHTACINDFYDESNSKRKVNTMTTTTNNMDSNNMNNGTANGGSTPGASSDGDLDFQGKADAAEKGEKGCGCNCSAKQTESREQPKSNEVRQPAEPSNPFPQSEAPSGDGTGYQGRRRAGRVIPLPYRNILRFWMQIQAPLRYAGLFYALSGGRCTIRRALARLYVQDVW